MSDPWEWPMCNNDRYWSELYQDHRQCPMYTRHPSGVCAGCRREAALKPVFRALVDVIDEVTS